METSLGLLDQLINEGSEFTATTFCYPNRHGAEFGGEDTAEWHAWKVRTHNLVLQLTAEESPAATLVKTAIGIKTSGEYIEDFARAQSMLLEALNLTVDATKEDLYGELRGKTSRASNVAISNRIFVVHGHDDGLKTDVERFVRELGLEPVVLHRQPDQGRTIIEKFEKHSDVGFALILLTPDEVAYPIAQVEYDDHDRATEHRARPNVIFEFGYFVGKLGRDRVCCLHKAGAVVPSDLDGLVYKPVDESLESQAYSIIQELRAAGYKLSL